MIDRQLGRLWAEFRDKASAVCYVELLRVEHLHEKLILSSNNTQKSKGPYLTVETHGM